ncbi:uncharacterized protein LOC124918269 [Impatiens glandulifera]|uniref:uncharacterized protein LOC124918269 n=1 Tax=Impatiens glandulifera TaxID=253017 RepID=UPI001FB08650|nr:uncharacterized protein LOC124918269 [Impatiens glandulifera]
MMMRLNNNIVPCLLSLSLIFIFPIAAVSPTSAAAIAIIGAVIVSSLVVIAAVRAAVVVWITVLVLLAFAGNRRRALAARGRKITADVAVQMLKVVIKEKGIVALGTMLSLTATATCLAAIAM